MRHDKILGLLASTLILTGCALTNSGRDSVAPDAPPSVASSVASTRVSSGTDISSTYSTTTGGGTMMETSVSAPIAQETPVAVVPAQAGAPATAVNTAVPHIPNANSSSVRTAAVAPARNQQQSSVANGFDVNLAYNQAWSKTARALPAAGYSVMEKDETSGTYYVIDKAASGGKIERNTPIYQVRLTKASDTSTKVILLDSNNRPASGEVANRILGGLQKKLK